MERSLGRTNNQQVQSPESGSRLLCSRYSIKLMLQAWRIIGKGQCGTGSRSESHHTTQVPIQSKGWRSLSDCWMEEDRPEKNQGGPGNCNLQHKSAFPTCFSSNKFRLRRTLVKRTEIKIRQIISILKMNYSQA